ncbi:MAG: HAMP domain-containing histidine kinase [Planctomycetales bacterium]|nr:HAMP domain-containing histidine kinase [Planctomycetales bacterium]
MPTRDSTLSGILRSPARILAIILILVFCTEVVVMLVLPYVIPRFLGVTGEAFVDAVLLTLVCAPVLWFVILAAKRAEEQRIDMARETEALRAQQMTTLAQLATGVAHEIRNPLTSIKMLIQVNRAKFAEEGLPTEDLELVEQEIRRMERSVNSLLDYARPEPSTFEPVVIQSVIRKTVHLIDGRCSAEAVELNVDVPKSPITIIGDSAQLKQLLLNLVLNAFDAMPGGGKLCLNLTEQDDAIALSVQDTGSGICEEVESRLFSPFVTTKANGVGLGLGICRRIAELHNGTLTGFNRATGGAEFLLTLPKTQGQEHPSQDGTASIPMARSDIEGSCKVC